MENRLLKGRTEQKEAFAMTLSPRVLVIDDDPSFRNLLFGLLKNSYDVITVASGPEGYQLAMDHPPHAALIDIQMPGWDGLETLKKFREHPDLERVKTAMLTGDASRNTVVSAIRAGADEYLVKTDFSKEELLMKLKLLLSKSSLLQEEEAGGPVPSRNLKASFGQGIMRSEADSRLQELIDGWE